jgi:hypothetical protein
MKKKRRRSKNLIGRRELVNFPDLGLEAITAKIDTGAYTSALHCHDIYVKEGVLHFKLLSALHEGCNEMEHSTNSFTRKDIRNSFGETESRYLIKTRIQIGKRTIKSLISLTDRGTMRYPVLIGRRLLKNRFVVDVSCLNLASQHIPAEIQNTNIQ